MKGRGHMLLDFHALTKALFNLQVSVTEGLKLVLGGERGFNVEDEVSKWTRISVDENSYCS